MKEVFKVLHVKGITKWRSNRVWFAFLFLRVELSICAKRIFSSCSFIFIFILYIFRFLVLYYLLFIDASISVSVILSLFISYWFPIRQHFLQNEKRFCMNKARYAWAQASEIRGGAPSWCFLMEIGREVCIARTLLAHIGTWRSRLSNRFSLLVSSNRPIVPDRSDRIYRRVAVKRGKVGKRISFLYSCRIRDISPAIPRIDIRNVDVCHC